MSYSVKGTSITLTRGDTFTAKITIMEPDGYPYQPIEGDRVRFAMKKNIKDEEVLLFKEIPIETMTLVLEPEDTKELEFTTYLYDIQITKRSGEVDTFITKSTITITEEVD